MLQFKEENTLDCWQHQSCCQKIPRWQGEKCVHVYYIHIVYPVPQWQEYHFTYGIMECEGQFYRFLHIIYYILYFVFILSLVYYIFFSLFLRPHLVHGSEGVCIIFICLIKIDCMIANGIFCAWLQALPG